MAEEMIVGYCPHCGKKLQVPADLERFACMYCAEKMTQSQLLAELPKPVAASAQDIESEFTAFEAAILNSVTDYPESYKKVNKTDFADYSEAYLTACRPAIDHLERCARMDPEHADEWAVKGAESFIRQVDAWLTQHPDWKSKRKRNLLVDNTKFTIALFLIPMLSRVNWQVAKPFARKVRELWLKNHPESPFSLATYQDLLGGFRKRWFCFITTAICEQEGKPDDCAELTAFRHFRDNWLVKQPDGPALVQEYYDTAPFIVMHINYCDDAPARYKELRENYLQPCYTALQEGRLDDCKQTYVTMVRDLQKRYLAN